MLQTLGRLFSNTNYKLHTASFIQVQVPQLPGRGRAERHLVVVVDDPAPLLVLDVTHVVAGVAGAAHVRDEGRQLVTVKHED